MWILDALYAEAQSFHVGLLTATTEQRAVDRAIFIPSEFHGIPPDWRSLACAGSWPMRGSAFCNCLVAPNVILIADCAAGPIWRVDVSEDGQAATAVEWLKHPSMAPGRDPSMAVKLTPTVSIPYPGINGIRYARKTHFVYYTSSSHSLFMRVAVDPVTHKPAGEPEVVAEDLHGVDDFCIDEKANVAYIATHVKNTILRVPLDPATLDSPRRAVVVEPISGQLSGPSSLAWGRGSVDYGRVAFASTDGGHTAHTGPVQPAAVVRVEFEEGSGVQHR